MLLCANPVSDRQSRTLRDARLLPSLCRRRSRPSALPMWSGLLLSLALCSNAGAQIGETRSRTNVWSSYAANPQGFAFDNVFPGSNGPNGCLSPPGVVTLPLAGGSVQVSLSTGTCPIRDESGALTISDAYVDNGTTLTFLFSPPISAFYTTYGSVAPGQAMSMRVKSADGRVDHLMAGLTSTTGALATGHGFISRVPIRTIEFTSSEAGTSVVGNFIGLASGQDSLGDCTPDLRGITISCDFLYAYGTTLPEGILLQPDGGQPTDVDISGDTAIAATSGVVNIFERNAGGVGNWGVVRKIGLPSGVDAQSAFGASAAIDGDTLVVGAPYAIGQFPGVRTGRAFVYGRNAGGANAWGASATLDLVIGAQAKFGTSVGIDGEIIAVGAPVTLTDASSGLLQIFERSAGAWDPAFLFSRPYVGVASTGYGRAIDVSGDSVVVGEPLIGEDFGLAHVYSRSPGSGGTWSQSGERGIGEFSRYGAAVAILVGQPGLPDRMVIGAPQNPGWQPPLVPFGGMAFGYQRGSGAQAWNVATSSDRWYLQTPQQENAYAGAGVAMAGSRVYVSAPRSTSNPGTPPRRVFAYPFRVTQGSPVGVAILRPDDLPLDDISGPIAADGHDLLVAGRESAAWIISFEAVFADSFEQ